MVIMLLFPIMLFFTTTRPPYQGLAKEGLDLRDIGLAISEVRATVVGVGNQPQFLRFPRRRVQALRIARVHHPIVLPVNNQERARRDGRDIPQGSTWRK